MSPTDCIGVMLGTRRAGQLRRKSSACQAKSSDYGSVCRLFARCIGFALVGIGPEGTLIRP